MPWKTTTMFEEKREFISEYLSGNYSITDLAREFNISRPTAYRLIKNYKLNGPKSFEILRSTPGSFPNQTAPEIQTAIKYYRNKHKNWGARKIKVLLEKEFDPLLVPSATTIHSF